jgi:hypothetical protein
VVLVVLHLAAIIIIPVVRVELRLDQVLAHLSVEAVVLGAVLVARQHLADPQLVPCVLAEEAGEHFLTTPAGFQVEAAASTLATMLPPWPAEGVRDLQAGMPTIPGMQARGLDSEKPVLHCQHHLTQNISIHRKAYRHLAYRKWACVLWLTRI